MVRYPHTLTVKWDKEGEFATGYYTPGDEQEVVIQGRAEANGKGNLVRTDDGAQVVYDWTFFFPVISTDIPYGAGASLVHNTGTWTGTVKRLAVNQKGAQIWL